jgi:crotonobetainyl-CoA:carnitine CoA-transferase CaiB-like acyl-CoA transferase
MVRADADTARAFAPGWRALMRKARDMALPLPLAGVRVLDLGMFWAGPYAGRLLADMGAEVIKVEGPRRPDPLRLVPRGLFPNGEPGTHPWNRSGMINERNRNKLGIALDLVHARGKALFKDLVAISDVVLENFSARVMPKLGLDYPVLRQVNPRLVMVSIASQGLTGPERDYVSVDPIVQALSGLASLTGPPEEMPKIRALFSDPLAAVLAAGGALAGLLACQQTGQGVHIDCSQREMLTAVMGSALMDYAMNGRVATTQGNDDPTKIIQGCFPCQGERGWVTISIDTEDTWQRLCGVLGHPDWTREPHFAEVAQRRQHRQEAQAYLAEWTRSRTKFEVTQQLQAAGIPAGPVLSAKELFDDGHLQEREFFEVCTHPEAGTHSYYGRPMQLTKTPLRNNRPAPCFGEHNHYVFGELLGLSDEDIATLIREEIVSTHPLVPMGE